MLEKTGYDGTTIVAAQCRSIQISLIIDSAVKLFRIQKVIMFHSYSSRHITSLKRLYHNNSSHVFETS